MNSILSTPCNGFIAKLYLLILNPLTLPIALVDFQLHVMDSEKSFNVYWAVLGVDSFQLHVMDS